MPHRRNDLALGHGTMNLALLAMPLMAHWLPPKLLSRLRLLAETRCGRLVRAAMGVLGSLCWGEPRFEHPSGLDASGCWADRTRPGRPAPARMPPRCAGLVVGKRSATRTADSSGKMCGPILSSRCFSAGRALLSKCAIHPITDFQTKLVCAPRPRQNRRSQRRKNCTVIAHMFASQWRRMKLGT